MLWILRRLYETGLLPAAAVRAGINELLERGVRLSSAAVLQLLELRDEPR